MDCKGIFDTREIDSAVLNKTNLGRDRHSLPIEKVVRVGDIEYVVPFRSYKLFGSINHGLCRGTDVLPSDLPIQIRFHRAPYSFSLMKMSNTLKAYRKDDDSKTEADLEFNFPELVVPIKNPVLNCYYSYSPELERTMSRISSYTFESKFLDYEVRRHVLDTGLQEYTLNLFQGPLPKFIVCGLSTMGRTQGDENLSLTRFEQYGLDQLDFTLDRESILGYPLTGSGENAIEFYQNYLQSTHRAQNAFSSAVTSFAEYLDGSFITVLNLEALKIFDGLLQVWF